MSDTVKFSIGQRVYHLCAKENVGIVTGILFRPHGVIYLVTWSDVTERYHFEIELSAEQQFSAK